MASVKAISAARLALASDGSHFVSLDKVIRTIRDTGRDMNARCRETSSGGVCVNMVESEGGGISSRCHEDRDF